MFITSDFCWWLLLQTSCSRTRRADFPKGFPPEKRALLVTGPLQSTSCLWHSFTCCTSGFPRGVTWTDIHPLMREEGWKSKDALINSERLLSVCVSFWRREFCTPRPPVRRRDTGCCHSPRWWMEQRGWFTITRVTQTLALVPELWKAVRIKEINGKVLQLQK